MSVRLWIMRCRGVSLTLFFYMSDSLADAYFGLVVGLLERVRAENAAVLAEVGRLVAASLNEGGVLHTFGSGHSAIIAQELVHRAGGLVPVSQILDPANGLAENVPGYGRKLAERYCLQYGMRAGEWILVISNSGKNASPVDVALFARERGLRVVGLCSVGVSMANKSEHPSGLRLHEVAEFVLDNGSVQGDAAMVVPGSPVKTGPTSTMTGGLLLNLLNLEIVAALGAYGKPLPLLQSGNTPGGKERNEELGKAYQSRLSRAV